MGYIEWMRGKYAAALDASLRELKKSLAEHVEECSAESPRTCPYERKVNAEIARQEEAIAREDDLGSANTDADGLGDEVSEAARILRNLIPGMKVVEHDTADDALSALPEDVRLSIPHLFTGTAADYDKPSLHSVGTGEGSQVYGWGLYASNQRGVAESYAKIVADEKDLYRNEKTGEVRSNYPTKTHKGMGRLIGLDGLLTDDAESAGWKKIEQGNIYEQTFFTNREPGDESHLLSWYEPVGKENFNRIVAQALNEPFAKSFDRKQKSTKRFGFDENTPAGDVYNRLSSFYFNSPQAVSEFLARADIDGVKYPVDSYGGKTVKDGDKAGWNYVSFRDDNIRVDRKWVDGVEVPVGLAAQGGDIRLMALRGWRDSGIEVFESPVWVRHLPLNQRMKMFRKMTVKQYRGRTARFVKNGQTFYATIDDKDAGKIVYGEKRSDRKGKAALSTVGASGDFFDLVEQSRYAGSKNETGKSARSHDGVKEWDYFHKTVQIDTSVYDIVVNVKDKGNDQYVYCVQMNENKRVAPRAIHKSVTAPQSGVGGGNPSTAGILPQMSVNAQDEELKYLGTEYETRQVLGWYNRRTGDVHLVKGAATAKTVLHELGWHATFQWAEKNAPELHRQMMEYAKNAPESVKDAVRKTYGTDSMSPEALLDEIGAERFTQDHADKFEKMVRTNLAESRTWWGRVKNGVRGTWERFVDRAKGRVGKDGRIDVARIAGKGPSEGMADLFAAMSHGRSLGAVAGDASPFPIDAAAMAERMLHDYLSRLRE